MAKQQPSHTRQHWLIGSTVAIALFLSLAGAIPRANSAPPFQITATGILVEAIGEANVRSGPGIEYDLLGTIYAGTRYEALGQHEFFPWILIEYPSSPTGQAWVYADLVTLSVPLSQLPLITEIPVLVTSAPSPTLSQTATLAIQVADQNSASVPTTPPTSDDSALPDVYMVAEEEINVRFGPGIDYPRIGRIQPGVRYRILSRHTLYPWYLIELPDSPNGSGWVYADVVEVTGNVNDLPVISVSEVGWPTLTPTPPFVVTSVAPWGDASAAVTQTPSIDIQTLGDTVLNYLLGLGFAPEEDRFGSVFVLDLATGANFSLGRDIAYSGMSLIKIPILVAFYRQATQPADSVQAELIANTMVCSGNHTANELLSIIGNGDPFAGAQRVTAMMQALGLINTFIVAPFKIGDDTAITDHLIASLDTEADQTRAFPDPYNQTTPADLGWLLNAVYQCATTESGPLMDVFPGQFTATECRQIIQTMSYNQINVLTEAGVPTGTRVAHKHGWIDDTHGDAAIVFTPGGDFVLTMAFYQPDWLPYELSWPTMAEVARLVYNTYNPDAPLAAIHPSTVNETCDLTGSPVLSDLMSPVLPPIE